MIVFPLIWLAAAIVAVAVLIWLRPGRHISWLVLTALLAALAVWMDLPDNPGILVDFNNDGNYEINKPIKVQQGLDLAGGVQVLLEADLPPGEVPESSAMEQARRIISDRIDALGALNPVIQFRVPNRIIVEIPGYQDVDQATALIKDTALLEFVECPFPLTKEMEGQPIQTDYKQKQAAQAGVTVTPETGATAVKSATPTTEATATLQAEPTVEATPTSQTPICTTVMTGDILSNASPRQDRAGQWLVEFTLTPDGAVIFGDYTTAHVNQPLTIVLDGKLISSPNIRQPITGGTGQISGSFTRAAAEKLATQLRYGALPVPLKVQSSTSVGPTLGQISIQSSIRAGIIGIITVLLFMILYYRVPGISAALALLVFAALNFAIYKFVPITLTLPAIIGFLISIGTAVDGNILIFERMKEELRRGRDLEDAVELGFTRAWTSIRDSNLSTIIICLVLIIFGTSFGAGVVTGFALTLGLGVIINLFTAIIVTRTFLHFILLPLREDTPTNRPWLLGL